MNSTIEQIKSDIEAWFARVKRAGLVVPNGWWGRPYDSDHDLTYIEARPHQLLIELRNSVLLIFAEPKVLVVENSILSIEGFTQLVISGLEEGNLKPYVRTHNNGVVRFVVLSREGASLVKPDGSLVS